jgi:hypothetical protein
MTLTALSLAIALLSADPTASVERATGGPILRAAARSDTPIAGTAARPRWMVDTAVKRPAALPVLYSTFSALQLADAYSTQRALKSGAVEVNPLMKAAAGNSGTMYATKAASAVASIYLAEKAWKKNRTGAVILMAILNGVSAAVVANNLRNAGR